jgi:hypothetical protein
MKPVQNFILLFMTLILSSPHSPLNLLHISLFVFNTSLLVQEKQSIPQNSFLYPPSRKMGQFTAAIVERISCLGVWKLPRMESSRQPARPLLSLAQTTTKQPQQQQQNMPRVHRHTQTRPQNQPNGQGFKERGLGGPFLQQGISFGIMPQQPNSQLPPPSVISTACCKCADTVHRG